MDRKKVSRHSTITRRQFLQSAVLGIAATQLAPVLQATAAELEEEIEIIGGWLTSLDDQWLEVRVGSDSLRRVPFDGNTSFWRGAQVRRAP